MQGYQVKFIKINGVNNGAIKGRWSFCTLEFSQGNNTKYSYESMKIRWDFLGFNKPVKGI